ncbi:MAG: FKBP-type peptidyl-prolyl cis-trans isomerase [Bacteroidales bacterium]|nr:FKBP-type peptidyl-prolyl cis-trans isomerase [Bacteroidales bacterium]
MCSCQNSGSKQVKLENEIDSLSYAIGINLHRMYSEDESLTKLDSLKVLKGFEDATNQKEILTDEETENVIRNFIMKEQAAMQQEEMAQFEVVKIAGEQFLAENAKRPEVKTTASGLQYEVITEGKGKKPKETSTVKVHYKGTTIDGEVFDSSYERGEPTEFPLNRVIPGWTEGLQLMSVGSKYKLYIPYQLAYGEQGAGGVIMPYSALIFEVELLEIK